MNPKIQAYKLMQQFVLGDYVENRFHNFKGEKLFPLGTYDPPEECKNPETMTENDYVWYPIPDPKVSDSRSVLLAALQGMHKTQLTKRFLTYYWQSGAQCAVFDPKGFEYRLAKGKYGSGQRHHYNEAVQPLPIKPLMYHYVYESSNAPPDQKRFFQPIGFPAKNLSRREDWVSLGYPDTGTEWLMKQVASSRNLQEIIDKCQQPAKYKLHIETAKGIWRRLDIANYYKFFSTDYHNLQLNQLWSKPDVFGRYKIPVFSYFMTDPVWMSTTIGYRANEIRLLAQNELRSGQKSTESIVPKFLIFDDATAYAQGDPQTNLTIQSIRNLLYNFRSYKINMMLCTQNIGMIDETIIEGFKDFMIAKIGNISRFSSLINDKNLLLEMEQLEYDPLHYKVQYMWIKSDRRNYETFYTLCPPTGHNLS
jgi:hypothetical protein